MVFFFDRFECSLMSSKYRHWSPMVWQLFDVSKFVIFRQIFSIHIPILGDIFPECVDEITS